MPEFDNGTIHSLVGGAPFEPVLQAPAFVDAELPDNVTVYGAEAELDAAADAEVVAAVAADEAPPADLAAVAQARLDARGGI